MDYRIESKDRTISLYYPDAHMKGVGEVKDFIKNGLEPNAKIIRIVKCYKDGRGVDVTNKFIRG